MKEILFITGNASKLKEYQHILGDEVILTSEELDLHEIQDGDVEVVARQKALDAFTILKKSLIVEDAGLELLAFDKHLPGALIKWLIGMDGCQTILDVLSNKTDRRAVAKAAIGYCDENGNVEVFVGEVSGSIPNEIRGTSNFGFDPVFIPDGRNQTYAEMTLEEKSELSHRRKAIEALKAYLNT